MGEEKRVSEQICSIHLTAYTGRVQAGLTRIIKGFNGGNLREAKCAAECVTGKDKQTERTERSRQTVELEYRAPSPLALSLKSLRRKYVEEQGSFLGLLQSEN